MRRSCTVAAALLSAALLVVPAPAQADLGRPRGTSAIVFVSDRDSPSTDEYVDDVYVLTPRDGRVFRMTEDGGGAERNPTLSPDGRWLAFVRLSGDSAGTADPTRTAVYVCPVRRLRRGVACGPEQQVVVPVADSGIAWTPDSRSLVYSGPPTAERDTDLYVVRARGGTPRNLTDEPADGVAVTNNQPAVARGPRGAAPWVYHAVGGRPDLNGGDLVRRPLDGSSPAERLTAAPNNDNGVDVSPDGRRLVFHSNRTDPLNLDIWTMRAAPEGPDNPAVDLTAALRELPSGLPGDDPPPSQERRPSWSPDGRRIAFHWYTRAAAPCLGCTDGEIYSMRADGSDLRNETANNPVGDEQPTTPYADITPDWGRVAPRR